jgi:hypothetical protein
MLDAFREFVDFRNASHETYFWITFAIFIVYATSFAWHFWKRSNVFAVSLVVYAIGCVGVAVWAAVYEILGVVSEAFSVDCIWYNSSLGVIYTGMAIALQIRKSTGMAMASQIRRNRNGCSDASEPRTKRRVDIVSRPG